MIVSKKDKIDCPFGCKDDKGNFIKVAIGGNCPVCRTTIPYGSGYSLSAQSNIRKRTRTLDHKVHIGP
ncbi:MAG: hypothetical protein PHS16_00390 [Candidatus Colwellbacteria bacterium]|jgi:hypothetical protein|nr:hypothetical protein [Candidatus Colwellbacteria bacterium]MDD4818644.1 hypothetical protein [Candidatus Colwellbacteria bacterium]